MAKIESGMEAMLDVYIFESNTLLEQLDEILIRTESNSQFGEDDINEIFRIMHTIKGSSAMMGLDNMSTLAHTVEDMFFIIRENKNVITSVEQLYELVFNASDLMKAEIEIIPNDDYESTDFEETKTKIREYIEILKNPEAAKAEQKKKPGRKPKAKKEEAVDEAVESEEVGDTDLVTVKVIFEDDCKMEHLRAFMLINAIKDDCEKLEFTPSDIETNPDCAKTIIEDGFIIKFKPKGKNDEIFKQIEEALNVKSYEVIEQEKPKQDAAETSVSENIQQSSTQSVEKINQTINTAKGPVKQNLISVNLNKLDKLLDMVGEIVITEAMVTSNPDLKGLQLDNFQKASRQLRKLTDELQDIVMSIRMVPLSGVFNKMSRVVRDMKVKLGKDVELVFEGEDTEVDKSIIDNLNDPLMHMVRNSMDHGIEDTPQDRIDAGKNPKGTVKLSAFNSSGEVIIVVSDDGKGINPEKVLAKAKKNGLLTKPDSEYTDKEIYNMVMLPGFSTKEQVSEFSGRGVGMDVVRSNIEKIGGTVSVDSKFGIGTNFIIKIPLSLAILDGMEVSVGSSIFTIPINSIRESFKIKSEQIIKDTEGKEMLMIRGKCYPLIRLHEIYELQSQTTKIEEGIILLVEAEGKRACILADELIGEQQVVVKPFSPLFKNFNVKQNGMAGCTILGDGSITIILDVNNIITNF